MQSKTVVSVIALVCMGAFALTLLWINHRHDLERAEFFQEALTGRYGAAVSVSDKQYSIAEGRVVNEGGDPVPLSVSVPALETMYFHAASIADPFFSLDGTDPQALDFALNELESVHRGLEHMYRDDAPASILIRQVYPAEFLRTLPETQESRNEFIEHPSEKTAAVYAMHLLRTAESYGRALRAYELSLQRALPSGTDRYVFIDGSTDKREILSVLENVQKAWKKRELELRNTLHCIGGFIEMCDTSILDDEIENGTGEKSTSVRDTPPRILEHKRIVDASRANSSEPDMRIIVLPESACIHEKPVYYEVLLKQVQGDEFIVPQLLNELYFRDTRDDTSSAQSLRRFEESGLPYVFQPVSNPYICFGAAEDIGKINTLVWLHTELGVGGNVLSWSEAENYEADLRSRVIQDGKNEDPAVLIRKARTAKTVEDRSALFDRTVREIALLDRLALVTAQKGFVYSPEFIFLPHSYPAILLFLSNRSVFPENINILSGNTDDLPQLRLVSYSELSSWMSAQEASDVIKKTRDFFYAL